MEVINNIKKDQLAFYIGTALMCKRCEINLEKIKILQKHFVNYNFYQIDASNASTLINNYKITSAPFFIISVKGEVKEIFYSIEDLNILTKKLLYYYKEGESEYEKKR